MKTEIICIIDKSGSMAPLAKESIIGFNDFLHEQQKSHDADDTAISLVLFNHAVTPVYTAQPLPKAGALWPEDYRCGGSTGLLDAIGGTIDKAGKRFDAATQKPEKVICVILTDGEENSSSEYSHEQVASMIKRQREEWGWEFIYLGANQDAFAVGSKLNIPRMDTQSYLSTKKGTRDVYAAMSTAVMDKRKNGDSVSSDS